MSRAVLMSAISVVVKWTVLSSATGMFIRIKRCRQTQKKDAYLLYISFIYLVYLFISFHIFSYLKDIIFSSFLYEEGMNKFSPALAHWSKWTSNIIAYLPRGNFYLPRKKRVTLVLRVIIKEILRLSNFLFCLTPLSNQFPWCFEILAWTLDLLLALGKQASFYVAPCINSGKLPFGYYI